MLGDAAIHKALMPLPEAMRSCRSGAARDPLAGERAVLATHKQQSERWELFPVFSQVLSLRRLFAAFPYLCRDCMLVFKRVSRAASFATIKL